MWTYKTFDELTKEELYLFLKERSAIFVFEQKSPYHDIDGRDPNSIHISYIEDGELLAYSRIFVTDNGNIRIGRVLVTEKSRGKGLARTLFRNTLTYCQEQYPEKAIELNSEEYIKDFYASFGFKEIADPYLDSGVIHVTMLLE